MIHKQQKKFGDYYIQIDIGSCLGDAKRSARYRRYRRSLINLSRIKLNDEKKQKKRMRKKRETRRKRKKRLGFRGKTHTHTLSEYT